MANTAWKIAVGVNIDTSDIQSQLNKVSSKGLKINFDTGKSSQEMLGLIAHGQKLNLTYQAAHSIFKACTSAISSMVDEVLKLNKAEIELQKVSDLQGASLEKYVKKLGEAGREVGRSASEMTEAATMFRKSGFDDNDSAKLAKIATMYTNIADTEVDAADAASEIVSQLRAFGWGADEATHVIDAYNETANNFAVGTNDLSKAMQVAGAGLHVYGNSFEEAIGLITAGSEVMQGKSLQVARGLMTISANLVANEGELSKYGIAVTDANGELRSTYEILSDLKVAWDNMSDVQRTSLGNTLAGKNQFKVLASVMQNFETATDASKIALISQGSAMRENERYMQGLEAKIKQIKSSFQEFATAVVNSDLVNGILTIANAVLKLASSDIGVTLTQFILLSGLSWGGLSMLGNSILPAIASSFSTFGKILPLVQSGQMGFATASAVATGALTAEQVAAGGVATGITAIGSAITTSLPIIMAVAAAIVATVKIVDALTTSYKEQVAIVQELNAQYEEQYGVGSEYDKLIAKSTDLTEAEKNRLAILNFQKENLEEQIRLETEIEHKKWSNNANKSYISYGADNLSAGFMTSVGFALGASDDAIWGNHDTMEDYNAGLISKNDYLQNQQKLLSSYTDAYKTLINFRERGVELSEDEERYINNYEYREDYLERLVTSEAAFYLESQKVAGATQEEIEASTEYRRLLASENKDIETLTALQAEYVKQMREKGEEEKVIFNSQTYKWYAEQIRNIADAQDKVAQSTANAAHTLEAFKKALRGDLEEDYKGIADAYSQAVQDISAGKVGDASLSDAVTKILSPEKIAELGNDMQEAMKYISSDEILQSGILSNDTKTAAVAFQKILQDIGASTDEADQGLVTLNEDGSFSVDSWGALAEKLGLNEDYINALRETWQEFSGELLISGEEVDNIVDGLSELGQEADAITVLKKIKELTGSKDAASLQKWVDALQSAGFEFPEGFEKDMGILVQAIASLPSDTEVEIEAEVDEGSESEIDTLKDDLETISQGATANIGVNLGNSSSQIASLKSQLNALTGKYTVSIGISKGGSGDSGNSEDSGATAKVKATGTESFEGGLALINDGKPVNGSAAELVVANGEARIYNGGLPTIQDLPKGARIFNAEETQQILKGANAGSTFPAFAGGSVVNPIPTTGVTTIGYNKKASSKANKQIFDEWLAEQKHLLAMDLISEQDYYDALEKMYKEYLEGKKEYLDEYRQYEEEIYDWRKRKEEEMANQAKERERNVLVYKDGEFQYVKGYGYASGTTSAKGGLSLVGEQGAELRVLNSGDGILPHDITSNLWQWGSFTPNDLLGKIGNSSTVFSIGNIQLPNVTNAEEFVSGLKNYALQFANR